MEIVNALGVGAHPLRGVTEGLAPPPAKNLNPSEFSFSYKGGFFYEGGGAGSLGTPLTRVKPWRITLNLNKKL